MYRRVYAHPRGCTEKRVRSVGTYRIIKDVRQKIIYVLMYSKRCTDVQRCTCSEESLFVHVQLEDVQKMYGGKRTPSAAATSCGGVGAGMQAKR